MNMWTCVTAKWKNDNFTLLTVYHERHGGLVVRMFVPHLQGWGFGSGLCPECAKLACSLHASGITRLAMGWHPI